MMKKQKKVGNVDIIDTAAAMMLQHPGNRSLTKETIMINSTNPTNPTSLTIHNTRESANAAAIPAHRLIEVFKRMPTRYAGVWVPTVNIPSTAAVPQQFRAIVDAAITSAIQGIIDKHAFSGNYVPSWIPASALSETAILDALVSTGGQWLSKDELIAGWNASATFTMYKAKMLALTDAGQRKAYARALDRFSEDVCKLSAKGVKSITPTDAEKMLAKLAPADLDTPWGEFVAMRLGRIMKADEPEEIDLDSL